MTRYRQRPGGAAQPAAGSRLSRFGSYHPGMLVVTRKPGERVMVGDEVAVVVLDITASHVRLGIEAPKTVAIHRGEVWDQIAEQNRQVVAETPARLPDPAE